jgi:outer membrane protein assembly factor BamB
MKKDKILFLVLMIISCFADISYAQLASAPWPCYGQNVKHTGQSPYIGPLTPTLKWTFTTGNFVRSSPVIGRDNTIFVGSGDYNLYAVKPDGTLKWQYTTGNYIYSSPAVGSDGTVYVGSNDKNLYAINSNGTLKWTYATGDYVTTHPIIVDDGTIYFGSTDKKLYALNSNGTLKWTYSTYGHISYSSPAIADDGTIYIGTDANTFYAINPDGTKKWHYVANTISSTAVIDQDGTIYVGAMDYKLYAINPDGTTKWTYLTGGYTTHAPALGKDGTIYIGSGDHKLYALNSNGTLKWTFITADYIATSPAMGWDGTIYFGSDDNIFYALNPNGTIKWIYVTGNDIESSPAIGADGTVYFGSSDSKLYAFKDVEQTETPTSTVTQMPTLTQTLTATQTLTTTMTKTATPTKTSTPTLTPTPTFTDFPPLLEDGAVTPETGNQSTTFEFYVFYNDPDGGSPTEHDAYINGGQFMLNLKSGNQWNGVYSILVSGSQLQAGNNEFNFFFTDDEGNSIAFPEDGSFISGPYVSGAATSTPTGTFSPSMTLTKTPTKTTTNTPTSTPTKTSTLTNTPTGIPTDTPIKTQTPTSTPNPSDTQTQTRTPVPTISQTPTNTPSPTGTPQKCLRIACPTDFYYNTVLLSWTPIYEAEYYKFECAIAGNVYTFDIYDNNVKIIARNAAEWQSFIDVGAIFYRVTAIDVAGNKIDGPTNIVSFRCKPGYTRSTEQWKDNESLMQGSNTVCLRIANPDEFYFNTIILSWTPIYEADHYLMEYKFNDKVYSAELKDNYLRLLIPDKNLWSAITLLGPIPFRITAVDAGGNAIEGPTDWSVFSCL